FVYSIGLQCSNFVNDPITVILLISPEVFIHDIRVNKSKGFVSKSSRCDADNLKTKFLPKFNSGLVCADHDVKLNPQKSFFFCECNGVFAEQFSYPATLMTRIYHVATIGNMVTQPNLVGLYHVCTYNFVIVKCNKCVHLVSKPKCG